MKAVGIISEYNPFHDGHAYHIREAKRLSGAEFAVVVMNGDFVQRGEPAIFDKYTRAKQALEGGADLVFELPVRFGLSSAGDFAFGGVLALESLGFVSSICFGSEAGELTQMKKAADILADESEDFQNHLNQALRRGMSYPAARALALTATGDIPPAFLNEPNNILGIEYCLALKQLSSRMEPITIARQGLGYHEITQETETQYPSAHSLRKKIKKQNSTPHLTLDDFSTAIGYALLRSDDLCRYKDITPDIADRIQKFLPDYQDVQTLIRQCKNPTLTEGRIRRSLLQCLLDLKKTEREMPYLRLLGMKKEASSLLSQRENTSCQILSKLSTDVQKLNLSSTALWKKDLFASDLYRQIWCHKYEVVLPNEYQHSPLVM